MAEVKRTLQCSASEGFAAWLAGAGGAMAITTYQAGRVVLAGWNGRQVSVLPREVPKPMGLATRGTELVVVCKDEVIFFANAPLLAPHYPEENCGRYDALYLPRASYLTGDLNVHDIAFGAEGLWLVNTRFSCLSVLSTAFSFEPRWRPPFISRLVPEDRCHLNGLAMLDGRPKYVTAHAQSDTEGGWRPLRAGGGVLLDVETGETVLRDLCMPHSPRRYDGKWWLLNSGLGELWLVDPDKPSHEVVCRLSGYLRGLCFAGHYALVGLSQVRRSHVFEGLPVQEYFKRLSCGVAVVDLRTGNEVGMFEFTEGCEELYDVAFLEGVACPSILNMGHPKTREAVTAPDFAYWLRVKPRDGRGEHAREKPPGVSGATSAREGGNVERDPGGDGPANGMDG